MVAVLKSIQTTPFCSNSSTLHDLITNVEDSFLAEGELEEISKQNQIKIPERNNTADYNSTKQYH